MFEYEVPQDRMDPEFKAQWLSELRSGQFVQIRSKLRDFNNGRCCLGIACDVAVAQGLGQWTGMSWDEARDEYVYSTEHSLESFEWSETKNHDSSLLPDDLAQAIGVITPDPILPFRCRAGYQVTLSTLNDELRMTLDQIADLIDFFF